MAGEYGAPGTVFCMQCGKPNNAGARFCMFCGSELVTFSDPGEPQMENRPAEETYPENVFGDPVDTFAPPEEEE